MQLHITLAQALWFLPLVTPICLWVAWSDLRAMRIPNQAVLLLAGIFLVIGIIALPIAEYPWRLGYMVIALLIGIIINAAGLVGAGDAKFIAAAVPFVDPGDVAAVCLIFAANLLACFTAHRIAKNTALRRLAPEWESWSRGRKFPMGFSLGSTLVIYLLLGVYSGL